MSIPQPAKPKRRAVPLVEIQLDRPRRLKFGLNALAEIEDEVSRIRGRRTTWDEIKIGGIGASELRIILWAALKWEDPELTQEKMGDLFDAADPDEINSALERAYSEQMPDPKQGETHDGGNNHPLSPTG